jgi:hypothetical protein
MKYATEVSSGGMTYTKFHEDRYGYLNVVRE